MCPKHLGRERVEVGKGHHKLAVFPFADQRGAAKFGTEGFLHGEVAGEFDESPLLCDG